MRVPERIFKVEWLTIAMLAANNKQVRCCPTRAIILAETYDCGSSKVESLERILEAS